MGIAGQRGGDPALDKLLTLVSIDERAHYEFFKDLVTLYLRYDRPGTLEQLREATGLTNLTDMFLQGLAQQQDEGAAAA